MKKLTVIGRGTVGCQAVAHFLEWTDWNIEWVYDPDISTTSVGEGTTLSFPSLLRQSLRFSHQDLKNLGGTIKTGIYKEGWGNGQPFLHAFPINEHGIHFNATLFQNYAFNILKSNKRVFLKEQHITNTSLIDSDFIMVCSGTPQMNSSYQEIDMNVNACYVTQCEWDHPRFDYTLTIARPYGWVFGIPLQNRCSIGYVYNKNLNSLDDVRDDVKEIFKQFNLIPSDATRTLFFNNYAKKINFIDNIAYNGNSSFFLEPLEATSTFFSEKIIRRAYDVWHNNINLEEANRGYHRQLGDISTMIHLHYMAGSKFKTKFWKHSEIKSEDKIKYELAKQGKFFHYIRTVLNDNKVDYSYLNMLEFREDLGSWPITSYRNNITGLCLEEKLRQLCAR